MLSRFENTHNALAKIGYQPTEKRLDANRIRNKIFLLLYSYDIFVIFVKVANFCFRLFSLHGFNFV